MRLVSHLLKQLLVNHFLLRQAQHDDQKSIVRLAFIDIETTGARATQDRITEVAIKVIEGDQVICEWQSLVDPETTIPPFIQSLTGINNAMVKGAPVFNAIADNIEELTKGAVFVAHNVRFDYAFVKAEFRRRNRSFNRRVLCTVKLAKALYPQYKRHGLDALILRHQIVVKERHRAMADVDAMLAFFQIAQQEHATEQFDNVIKRQLKKPSLPKGLTEAQVSAIPDTPGVYRFYGENNSLLYVGKSVNLYQRVMSHFSSDHSSTKEMTIAQSVIHIDWTETAGDLGAQLLELKQIKTLNPIYNHRSRFSKTLIVIKLEENSHGFLEARLSHELDINHLDQHYGLYRSQNSAQKAVANIANKNDLCLKLLGLEHGPGPCFGYQTGACKGACIDNEDSVLYNLRMQIAFHELQLKAWPFEGAIGIKEKHPRKNWQQMYLVYNWCHLATVDSDKQLDDIISNMNLSAISFDLDTYKLLSKAVLSPKFKIQVTEL